jgi:hypothetical protein
VEYGGKNNSYVLGLLKQRQIKKSINKLIDENNEQITDQIHILSTIKSYYENLYTTKYPDENLTSNYIFDTKLEDRLQDQDQSICDGKVTEEECSSAINNMKLNKAPGLDGLAVAFYREFLGKVNFFLIHVLNKSYDEKLLSFSQRTSVLSLLFKRGIP